MGPALELEGEIVHVVEGDALQVVDKLGVRGLYEARTRALCPLPARGRQQAVESVGEHVDGISDEMNVGLLHLYCFKFKFRLVFSSQNTHKQELFYLLEFLRSCFGGKGA